MHLSNSSGYYWKTFDIPAHKAYYVCHQNWPGVFLPVLCLSPVDSALRNAERNMIGDNDKNINIVWRQEKFCLSRRSRAFIHKNPGKGNVALIHILYTFYRGKLISVSAAEEQKKQPLMYSCKHTLYMWVGRKVEETSKKCVRSSVSPSKVNVQRVHYKLIFRKWRTILNSLKRRKWLSFQ